LQKSFGTKAQLTVEYCLATDTNKLALKNKNKKWLMATSGMGTNSKEAGVM